MAAFFKHHGKFPAAIQEYFRARWDKQYLWTLDLPVFPLKTSELEWHLAYPFWSTSPPKPLFDLRPRAVLSSPSEYPVHWDRVLSADLAYPIATAIFGDRLVILDGLHRLVHAIYRQHAEVDHVVIPRNMFQSPSRYPQR